MHPCLVPQLKHDVIAASSRQLRSGRRIRLEEWRVVDNPVASFSDYAVRNGEDLCTETNPVSV